MWLSMTFALAFMLTLAFAIITLAGCLSSNRSTRVRNTRAPSATPLESSFFQLSSLPIPGLSTERLLLKTSLPKRLLHSLLNDFFEWHS